MKSVKTFYFKTKQFSCPSVGIFIIVFYLASQNNTRLSSKSQPIEMMSLRFPWIGIHNSGKSSVHKYFAYITLSMVSRNKYYGKRSLTHIQSISQRQVGAFVIESNCIFKTRQVNILENDLNPVEMIRNVIDK